MTGQPMAFGHGGTTGPGTLSVSTPSDREVLVTRAFAAPRTLVFDAHTKPELVRRWLTGPPGWTMPVCEIDARAGGRYRHELRGPSGEALAWGGVYREVVRPQLIVSAERFDDNWTGGETLNTLVLSEVDASTVLSLTLLYPSPQARDGALATGMTEGMGAGFSTLDDILAAMLADAG